VAVAVAVVDIRRLVKFISNGHFLFKHKQRNRT